MRSVPLCAALLAVLAPALRAAEDEAPQTPRERVRMQRPDVRIRAEATLQPLAWGEIVRHRGALLGAEVRLVVQHCSLPESWNAYLGRFGPGDFVQVKAWAEEQKPWEPWDFEEPAVRLYARRDGAHAAAFAGAKPYQRFEVCAVVQEVFAERPWLEVVRVSALPERLEEGAVIHAARGWKLAAEGAWALAHEELGRALAGAPPPRAREELERLRAACKAEMEKRASER
jgi:hypothetical protein